MKMSFTSKITAWICGLTIILTTSVSVLLYTQVQSLLLKNMGEHLLDIGDAGSDKITKAQRLEIQRLSDKVLQSANGLIAENIEKKYNNTDYQGLDKNQTLSKKEITQLQDTADFRSLSAVLKTIRGANAHQSEGQLSQLLNDFGHVSAVRYVNLVIPVPNTQKEYFISIASTDPDAYDRNQDGVYTPDEMGMPIGTVTKATPGLKRAASGIMNADDHWHQNRLGKWLSAAIPIENADGDVIAVMMLDYDVSQEQGQLYTLFNVFYILVINCILLSGLGALLIAKRLLSPLELLIEGAAQVAKQDYNVKINTDQDGQISMLADTFNKMVCEVRDYAIEINSLNKAYERFVPKEFLELLGFENITKVRLGDSIQKQMTVMFCDIRSFTSLSENMTPEDNFNFINGYLKRISPVLREYGGFVDKYIGDSIMAIFPHDPADAIMAAVKIQHKLADYNAERLSYGKEIINVAIGLHTGKLTLGTVGEEKRMDGTVISDTVNIAARLEVMAKRLDANLIISETTYQKAKKPLPHELRYMGRVKVKGKKSAIAIYEVLDGLPEQKRQARVASKEKFEMAIHAFYAGNRQQAITYFKELVKDYGTDAVTKIYLRHCIRHEAASRSSLAS